MSRFHEIGGRFDVIKGIKENNFRFSNPMLQLSFVLDGFSTESKSEKVQETTISKSYKSIWGSIPPPGLHAGTLKVG